MKTTTTPFALSTVPALAPEIKVSPYIAVIQQALDAYRLATSGSVVRVALPLSLSGDAFRGGLQRHMRIIQRELGLTVVVRTITKATETAGAVLHVWLDIYKGAGCYGGPIIPSEWPFLYAPFKDCWFRGYLQRKKGLK